MSEKFSNQELNIWLHEHLFGAIWYRATELWLERAPHLRGLRWLYRNTEESAMIRQKLIEPASGEEIPDELESVTKYSENISDAWKVVEELRARGWLAVVKDMPDGFPYLDDNDATRANKIFRRACADFQWMPRKDIEDTRKFIHTHVFTVADTVPRAICEAAKKAVEADRKYSKTTEEKQDA
jgi:hypothetical protein